MKCLFIFILCCTAIGNALSQTDDCYASLRKGTFYYVNDNDATIKRTRTTQTEIFNGGKSKLVMKIHWISNNEYLLKLVRSINVPGNGYLIGDILDVKITHCINGQYAFTFRTIRSKVVVGVGEGAIYKGK